LRGTLESPNPGVRKSAAEALGDLGDAAAVPDLAALAGREPESSVRVGVIMALGILGDPRVAPDLEPLLKDRDEYPRLAAGCALVLMTGHIDTGVLTKGLRSRTPWERFAVAMALVDLGTPEALDLLAGLLNDRVPALRRLAAGAVVRRMERQAAAE